MLPILRHRHGRTRFTSFLCPRVIINVSDVHVSTTSHHPTSCAILSRNSVRFVSLPLGLRGLAPNAERCLGRVFSSMWASVPAAYSMSRRGSTDGDDVCSRRHRYASHLLSVCYLSLRRLGH